MKYAHCFCLLKWNNQINVFHSLGNLFDLVRTINQARDAGAPSAGLQDAQDLLRELSAVLGLTLAKDQTAQAPAAPFVNLLLEVRTELRRQKLWALSDQIRDQLIGLGVILEDSRDGSTWRWE